MTAETKSLPLRILIVEDDPIVRVGLKQLLSAQPARSVIGTAEDGFRGVEAAITLKPDLVIMDVGMPHLDGIAATKQIKAALPEVRVVMLTSHTSPTEIIASLSSGADAYCIKGIDLERLLTAIAAVQDGATYLDARIAQQVVEQLKIYPAKRSNPNSVGQLSKRELQVLELIVEGYSNPEIAKRLQLSPNTIKSYVRGIMNKLMVNDRVQAAVTALRSGLVQ